METQPLYLQTQVIVFVVVCLAAALFLVIGTQQIVKAKWQERLRLRLIAVRSEHEEAEVRANRQAKANLVQAVEEARKKGTEAGFANGREHGIEEGKRQLAAELTKIEDQKERLELTTSTSARGRVRVRLVDGDGHILLHSPAGYGDKAKAEVVIYQIHRAHLV